MVSRQSSFRFIPTMRAGYNLVLLGIVAESKECGLLILDSKDKNFLLEIFKIFGMLSKNHNYDVCEIIKFIKDIIKNLTSCKKQG